MGKFPQDSPGTVPEVEGKRFIYSCNDVVSRWWGNRETISKLSLRSADEAEKQSPSRLQKRF